jgi:hypothetical protein
MGGRNFFSLLIKIKKNVFGAPDPAVEAELRHESAE